MSDKPIALVTGGAQGIGYACAEALAGDGHRPILADINEDGVRDAAEQLGDGAAGLICDMGDPAAIAALFDRVEVDYGPVATLVNNAGVALPGDFLAYALDDFQRVIGVNLVGVFVATQRAARTMVEKGIRGAIVNMSSINAQVAIPAIPAYCASKGGVMQITKAAALALAPHGIRVNAVGPGSIDTEMMAGVNANPEAMQTAMSRTPLKRLGFAARDRRCRGLPRLGKGKLHHGRDDLCRWRTAGAQLHLLNGRGGQPGTGRPSPLNPLRCPHIARLRRRRPDG